MKLKINLNRADLIWLNLYVAYKSPSNWSFVVFVWLGMSGMYFYRKGLSQSTGKIVEQLLLNAGVSFVIAVSMFLLTIIFTVVSSTRKAGVLGVHEYYIKENGLLEITEANETLVKWIGIKSIVKTKRFILVQINWYLFHTLPARCFSSNAEFEEFYRLVKEKVNASNNGE